jgi:hypothetical protein
MPIGQHAQSHWSNCSTSPHHPRIGINQDTLKVLRAAPQVAMASLLACKKARRGKNTAPLKYVPAV